MSIREFEARLTGYFPPPPEGYKDAKEALMEGGPNDMRGKPLMTLQDHLEGRVPYVSVAMDKGVLPYWTRLRIPALESHFGRPIEFRVVDTGGAFLGKGTSKVDVCVRGRQSQHLPIVNITTKVVVVDDGSDSAVKAVQQAVNDVISANDLKLALLIEDGILGPKTRKAIRDVFWPYISTVQGGGG